MSNQSDNNFNILSSILHGVIVTNKRGHIISWNKACEKILGYKFDEISGKPIRMLYGDDETMPFKKIMQECIEGNDIHRRWHAIHKTGKRLWIDIRAKIMTDKAGNFDTCIISICDIGKLIFTQKRLEKSMAISQAIFDTSLDAMITINEKTQIELVNRSAESMFGYNQNELIGKNVNMLLPFPFNVNHDKYLLNYLETGKSKIMNSRMKTQGLKKDGTIFPIDIGISEVIWGGNRIIAGVIRDLSTQRELEQNLVEIGNEERRKIGRDLHDGLGQMLTGIRMLAESLARKLQANALPAAGEVQEIADMIKQADQFTRELSRGMVQVDVERRGLSVAIQNLCDQTSKMTGVECSFFEHSEIEVENHTMALHIYRIIQESINNAIKHGRPKTVIVRLSQNMHHTSISIHDDGIGFDPEGQDNSGMGLQIMKYRAGLMGGVLETVRTEDNMTLVRCIIPNNMEHF